MTAVLWRPAAERIDRAQITAFAQRVGIAPGDYAALHAWSVREPAAFWSELWAFCGVVGERGARVVEHGERMPGARWFPDARLSFAENLLVHCSDGDDRDDHPAIEFRAEDGRRATLTFGELRARVAAMGSAMRAAGLGAGDRVAALLPNVPDAVVAMLGASALGAIWASCSPDFGTRGVLDRFAQLAPRILLIADAQVYKGVRHRQLGRLTELLDGLPSVERAVVVPCAGGDIGETEDTAEPPSQPRGGQRARVESLQRFLASGADADGEDPPPFARLPFDHPLYVLFSSGTTGKPKGIVHGAGGTLLQHLKEHRLHTDLGPGDRVFYYTTTGWMMWNWLCSALASGSTVVLYDGSPFHPAPTALWDLAADAGVTVFGTSAKHLDACHKAGLRPARTHDLGRVRTILSTGSPLLPETFDYVYRDVAPHVQLASISGGTDIVSCFVLGCPVLPVHRGEIQCRGLGMAVAVFDPATGRPVVGTPGELVCTAPFPSMPVGFWNDPDDRRYRKAYFEHFPGVWRHGDWATMTERGTLSITGRSDATLNPGGVRIGTAEIYRQVEQLDEIEESLAVGQDWQGDQRIVLFVVLREGLALTEGLRRTIRTQVRQNATARHVPAVILQVRDLPRTRSGKVSELAVRDVVAGREVANTEALQNPQVLTEFRDRPELCS